MRRWKAAHREGVRFCTDGKDAAGPESNTMQRIAQSLVHRNTTILGVLALIALSAATGCKGPEPVRRKPLPQPPVVTRSTPPLPAPLPRPKPLPIGGTATHRFQAQPSPDDSAYSGGPLDESQLAPRGGVRRGLWKVIVVHHSANDKDSPKSMDAYHRSRGWDGLGYHFVIGNGVSYPDGKIFVGSRWRRQQTGAHCKSGPGRYFGVWRTGNFFNENGIGICLVGNFDSSRPTAKQQAALRRLVAYLTRETGIRANAVYGHGEVTHKTACPGRNLRVASLRAALAAGDLDDVSIAGLDVEVASAGWDAHDAAAAHGDFYLPLPGAYALAKGVNIVNRLVLDAIDPIAHGQCGADCGTVLCDLDDHYAGGDRLIQSDAGVTLGVR